MSCILCRAFTIYPISSIIPIYKKHRSFPNSATNRSSRCTTYITLKLREGKVSYNTTLVGRFGTVPKVVVRFILRIVAAEEEFGYCLNISERILSTYYLYCHFSRRSTVSQLLISINAMQPSLLPRPKEEKFRR